MSTTATRRSAPAPEPLRLVRRPGTLGAAPVLDDSQRRVVDMPSGSGPVVVLGAPGTGKSTTLVESVVARVQRDGVAASSVLVVAPTRLAAAALRDRVTGRLARTVAEPLARTAASYAFALIRRAAAADGEPSPRLISGPEQDRILADLLAGHAAGEGADPGWPAHVRSALPLRGFRGELRDLLMRALERGLGPEELADVGRRTGRQDWVAAGRVLREYLEVTALLTPGAFDPAAIVDHAARLLESSPELLDAERRRWQLVAVDDPHQSTEALARLLDLLAGGGRDLLLAGDPDATTQGFRGADAGLLAAAPERFTQVGGRRAEVVLLAVRHRSATTVAEAARRIADGIGSTGAVRHRAALPASDAPAGEVTATLVRSSSQLGAFVARELRRAHLLDDVPWSEMAVVVRSSGQTSDLRRALAGAGVPVATPFAEVPVRDEAAVLPLRRVLRAVLRPDEVTAEDAVDLLTSPLGGADALGVRRLRQLLLAVERAEGGVRGSDDLLLTAVLAPDVVTDRPDEVLRDDASVDAPPDDEPGNGTPDDEPGNRTPAGAGGEALARVRAVLSAGRAAVAAPAATAETVLWSVWDASDLADRWRERALAGGAAGRRADRDLDAVVALFESVARFTDRMPGASVALFLAQLEEQDVPADTLAERAPEDDVVSLVTAQAAAGREWELVVVAGLQDGAWPDTRLRGSLLGASDLVDVLTGRDAGADPVVRRRSAREQVVSDERRLLHVAVTRARRRVLAVAVQSSDEQPSVFLDLVAPLPGGQEERPVTRVERAVSLPAVVGELRAAVLAGHADGAAPDAVETAASAAGQLARLAAAGVSGAHPRDWYGLVDLSDDAPLTPDGGSLRVSPSAVGSFDECALKWLLDTSGGRTPPGTSQAVGTLVHAVAEQLPQGSLAELRAALDERWPSLGLPDTWVGARERVKAEAMLVRLDGYLRADRRELVGTEVAFDVPVATADARGLTARLAGQVDRLERAPDDSLVVVDLKTGATPVTKAEAEAHPQLAAYQYALEQGAFGAGEVSGGAAVVQVGGSTRDVRPAVERPQKPLHAAPDPQWAAELLARTATGMAGRDFVAVVQDTCRFCSVRSSCPAQPEGRQVGSA